MAAYFNLEMAYLGSARPSPLERFLQEPMRHERVALSGTCRRTRRVRNAKLRFKLRQIEVVLADAADAPAVQPAINASMEQDLGMSSRLQTFFFPIIFQQTLTLRRTDRIAVQVKSIVDKSFRSSPYRA